MYGEGRKYLVGSHCEGVNVTFFGGFTLQLWLGWPSIRQFGSNETNGINLGNLRVHDICDPKVP
jgi:hypothetical protein